MPLHTQLYFDLLKMERNILFVFGYFTMNKSTFVPVFMH